jgi:hypothetical protein
MIEGIRGYGPPRAAARAGRGGGFHLPAARTDSAAPSMAPTAATGLLGLQQSWSPAEQDDAAQRRGHALLAELAAMQRDMLRGRLDPAGLSRLAAMAEGEAGQDAALREIVEGISLRAKVELARIGP